MKVSRKRKRRRTSPSVSNSRRRPALPHLCPDNPVRHRLRLHSASILHFRRPLLPRRLPNRPIAFCLPRSLRCDLVSSGPSPSRPSRLSSSYRRTCSSLSLAVRLKRLTSRPLPRPERLRLRTRRLRRRRVRRVSRSVFATHSPPQPPTRAQRATGTQMTASRLARRPNWASREARRSCAG
ncbi:hypothetical protein BJY59DRAFT_695977, partial [Rhodotorula toruloides]